MAEWDDIDELVDYWTFLYFLVRRMHSSALEPVNRIEAISLVETVDYKFQDLRRWENESS